MSIKDIHELLRQKELEISTLQIEVEALRIVAPLLSDDGDSGNDDISVSPRLTAPTRPAEVPKAANPNPQPTRSADWVDKAQGR